MINGIYLDSFIKNALSEDMPHGDITTDILIPESQRSEAVLTVKENGIIAGMDIAERVFHVVDERLDFKAFVKDGVNVKVGTDIARVKGCTASLLKAERLCLNILQRLSGIATITSQFIQKTKKFGVLIADTRKTTPGMRLMEKYAVKVGGGSNHRFSLSDGVLIKDNHIKACGSITEAVAMARKAAPHTLKIEVETKNMQEVAEALNAGADIIMLDNMDIPAMKDCISFINKRALVEASGGVNIDSVEAIASTGVDIISLGCITHSVKALDISMNFV